MNAKNIYVALGVMFFVSATAIALPLGATIRVVAAIPAAGSLCAALLQVFRDMIAHERALWTIEAQKLLDRRYISRGRGCLRQICAVLRGIHCGDVPNSYDAHPKWPPATALPHASSLLEIRRKWALWLTPSY